MRRLAKTPAADDDEHPARRSSATRVMTSAGTPSPKTVSTSTSRGSPSRARGRWPPFPRKRQDAVEGDLLRAARPRARRRPAARGPWPTTVSTRPRQATPAKRRHRPPGTSRQPRSATVAIRHRRRDRRRRVAPRQSTIDHHAAAAAAVDGCARRGPLAVAGRPVLVRIVAMWLKMDRAGESLSVSTAQRRH